VGTDKEAARDGAAFAKVVLPTPWVIPRFLTMIARSRWQYLSSGTARGILRVNAGGTSPRSKIFSEVKASTRVEDREGNLWGGGGAGGGTRLERIQ